ncbi:MAG TPA: hypothetical protein VIF57_26025 [Polyangia bacterium]
MLAAPVEKRTLAVLRRRLARFGTRIERVDVRFKDINGPRGGRDTVARVHVSVAGRPPVFVEQRAHDVGTALSRATGSVVRAMDRTVGKQGKGTPAPAPTHAPARPAARRARLGTEARQASAPERARRPRRGMVYQLEESATKPSRKSTRKSANRAKGASRLSRRTRRAKQTPRSRASRAQLQRRRAGGRAGGTR